MHWSNKPSAGTLLDMTFAVAGASGNTGGFVAETLLRRGAKVRVIVRDSSKAGTWKARGAEVVAADLGDARALARALRGAEGAYLLIPPNLTAPSQRDHQEGLARTFAEAVAESGIPHVVFLSAFAAHRERGSGTMAGLHYAERILGSVRNISLSSIRAGFFHELVIPLLGVVKGAGVLPSFFPGTLPIPMVGTRDVGRLAAELLLDPAPGNRVVELGSDLSQAEIALVLGKILGKPIRVGEIPLDAIAPTLMGMGFTPDLAGLYVEMIAGVRSGALVFEGTHRRVEASSSIEEECQCWITSSSPSAI
jgi:uncharacterized protein YbjT (DUF2867 family)